MKYLKLLSMTALIIISVSVFAQEIEGQKKEMQKTETGNVILDTVYQCPMKCEGDKTYAEPGKCPVCGMNLREIKKEAKLFTCPMHPEVTSDKPGKCSKCGMDLKEKKIINN